MRQCSLVSSSFCFSFSGVAALSFHYFLSSLDHFLADGARVGNMELNSFFDASRSLFVANLCSPVETCICGHRFNSPFSFLRS